MNVKRVVAMAALVAVTVWVAVSSGAPVVPVPDPIVVVTTKSGAMTKTTQVPVGGVPVPIDVDGRHAEPFDADIDVSVGLVAVEELPGGVLVPNIVVKRNALAQLHGVPSPPLELTARVILNDASTASRLATVHYGFKTPPGAVMPPVVAAKLVGPVTGGFIDPLKAKIDTPGYGGPLDFDIRTVTDETEASFALKFDPLPERVAVTEDPRDDGLELIYDHTGGPDPDVALDVATTLRERASGRTQRITAAIERLPRHLELDYTGRDERTSIEYVARTARAKPDIEASYLDQTGTAVATDARIELAGVPEHVLAEVDTRAGAGGAREIDGAAFEVLSAGRIDAVDFAARNWGTRPANLPLHDVGPKQLVSMVSRRDAEGATRFRMAGRLQGVRQIRFARSGGARDELVVNTLVGDGDDDLRGVLDLDDRGPGAGSGAKRQLVDTTVRRLPARLDVVYKPATDSDPLQLIYDSSAPVQVDSDILVAEGPASDCGGDRVICATAAVDDLPPHLEVLLPSKGGTDFSVTHTAPAGQRPNVRAAVDVGPDSTKTPASDRVWLRAGLEGVPNEVRGRMDTRGGELRAAEFHGCAYDFGDAACPEDARPDAIDDVSFTVRDQPSRSGLPPRPDVPADHVTVVGRGQEPAPKRFEVAGHVSEVRSIAFHQLDLEPGDGKTDGVLGARVEVGTGGEPFAVAVDDQDDAFGDADDDAETPDTKIGRELSEVRVDVDPLPAVFEACVRNPTEQAPPASLPRDRLLEKCQTTDRVQTREGEPPATPLSASYEAFTADGELFETSVRAQVRSTKPDLDDLDALSNPHPTVTYLDIDVPVLPGSLRADVVPPRTPDRSKVPALAGRRLQARYEASGTIPVIAVDLEQRRATSICEDPRPNRKALCLETTLRDLPGDIRTTYDPDPRSGEIDIDSTEADADEELAILPLHLSKVSPERTSKPLVVDARILGVPDHVEAFVQDRELDGENLPGRPTIDQQIASCSDGIDNDGDSTATKPGLIDAKDSDCADDTARLDVNACPDDGPCDGIDGIVLTATDQLVPDPDPIAPLQPPGSGTVVPPDPTIGAHEFSYDEAGEFRARAEVGSFKRLQFSKVDDDGRPSRVTRIAAGLGSGEPMKVHVDRDTGRETERLDATVGDAPKSIEVCLREPSNPADLTAGDDGDFCERTLADRDDRPDADKMALQTRVEGFNATSAPDIDVSRFEVSKGGGFEVLGGKLNITDLAERIDVLVGKDAGTEVRVEGHRRDDDRDDAPVAVAKRVTFAIRNFRDEFGLSGFPWDPSTRDALDPSDDPRNDDVDGRNYLQLEKDFDGRLRVAGSVPDIRQIHLAPRPCDEDSAITPTTGFGSRPLPDYKCIRAAVAPGRKLGLAVRTQEGPGDTAPDKLDVFDLEEGHVTKLPDSLAVTLAKSPESQRSLKRCSDPAPAPCRPPLLSLEATGDDRGQLIAKLAQGNKFDVSELGTKQPDDVLSRRVGFDESPHRSDFEEGARVKVGTNAETGATSLRLAAKLALPRFLDLDPFLSFDCTHEHPDPRPEFDCNAQGVGSEHNHGYESKDMEFRLVAAENEHFGDPSPAKPRLGRVALMVEPLFSEEPKDQIVLSGMPQPDNADPVRFGQGATGASSRGSGNLPPETDPTNRGFLAPAHLDARLFFRNDYNSENASGQPNGRSQTKYTQVDGRINVPMTLAARINERLPEDQEALAGFLGSANRQRDTVPTTQLTVFNAPSSNNAGDYAKPTFRVRAELRKPNQAPGDPGFVDSLVDQFVCGGNFDGPFCLVVPDRAAVRYLDVQMNPDPGSNGQSTTADAARTVDAVGGPFGADSNIDMRGFREVRGPGQKGPVANFTPAVAARLTNFNIGLRADVSAFGLGVEATYEMLGDLVLGAVGPGIDRLRLGHSKTSAHLKSEDATGPAVSRVLSDLRARQHIQVKAKLLFGSIDLLNLRFAEFHQPIQFTECPGFGGIGIDGFGTASEKRAAMSLSLTSIFTGGATNAPLALLSDVFKSLGCTPLFETKVDELVSRDNAVGSLQRSPAPGYTTSSHPVPDQVTQGAPVVPTTPLPPHEPGASLDVESGEQILCGQHLYEQVTVRNGATLKVGPEGTTDSEGTACDGTLTIEADKVVVEDTATITASAAKAAGTGGKLVVVATDLVNDGTIVANGAPGDAVVVETGGACLTGATGKQGGELNLAANLIEGTGSISARGGTGGDGGIGGMGGIGGRVRLNTVAAPGQTTSADGGDGGGTATGFCDAAQQHPRQQGAQGAAGTSRNDGPEMASEVVLAEATPGPYTKDAPQLRVKALSRQPDVKMSVFVCARRGEFAVEKPFGSHLDPFSTVSHELFTSETDRCWEEEFGGPTSGHHTYERTVHVPQGSTLFGGVYGFFGFARRPFCENLTLGIAAGRDGWSCISGVQGDGGQNSFAAQYVDQQELLPVAKAKIGYDPVEPDEPRAGFGVDGPAGCVFDSACLADGIGSVDVTVDDDDTGSGIRTIECRVTHPNLATSEWFDCSGVPTTVTGLSEGLNKLEVQAFDRAGNRSHKQEAVRWFVDKTDPQTPTITLDPAQPDGKNGWRKTLPAVTVDAKDPRPSAGLVDKPITVYVDEGQAECGNDDPGRVDDVATSQCKPSLATVGEGDHVLAASVTDRLGHTSEVTEPVPLRTDDTPPRSRLALGPRQPDGHGGWYRSKPFVAFTASDGPGGSGVDPSLDTDGANTGIHYKLDGDPWKLYVDDGSSDEPTIVLDDGTHEICWYAIDVAGNREDADPSNTTPDDVHCRDDILVDSTGPTVTDAIDPAAPDGENGFYVTRPTVTMDGADPGTGPKSELDRVEFQVDDGAWQPAAPVVVDSGTHTVRVRAFDKAGNPGPLLERTVSVDLGDPEAKLTSFPPRPNDQGLFRRTRTYAVAVTDERGGSGPAGARHAINGGAPQDYAGPFAVTSLTQSVSATPRDRAGHTGPAASTATARLDLTAPKAAFALPQPTNIISTLIGLGAKTTMRFTASDPGGVVQNDVPPLVKVTVVVIDALGNPVRRIPAPGTRPGGWRDPGDGAVVWDGTNDAGRGVLPGIYHYRVQATDQAGNTITSTESLTFLVVQGLLPLLG